MGALLIPLSPKHICRSESFIIWKLGDLHMEIYLIYIRKFVNLHIFS